MNYHLRHVTTYEYAEPVDLGVHLLHLAPRDLPGQIVESSEVRTEPAPLFAREGRDHFGNRVTWLFLPALQTSFAVTSEARVAVGFPAPPAPEVTAPWERVAGWALAGSEGAWRAAEFVFDSPYAPADPATRAYTAASFPPGRPILAGLLDLLARMAVDFTFRPGVTTISTRPPTVLAQRAGVCQDFSHLMIAGLRGLGLPARYVSGYIRTRPRPGEKRRRGADQSHAWVGCWLGPEAGWVDLDPTNNLVVRDEHVVIGWGRDYGDVSPVRGVIMGGGSHGLAVSVDLEAA